eukprot:Rmarinus@m.6939
MANTVVGTPYYMAPELFQDISYNHKSDMWSLGCILYEMASLRHPFNARSIAGLMKKVIVGSFTPIPDCYSRDLNNLVASLLAVSSDSRPSAYELLHSPFVKQHMSALTAQLELFTRPRSKEGARPARPSSSTSISTASPDPGKALDAPRVQPKATTPPPRAYATQIPATGATTTDAQTEHEREATVDRDKYHDRRPTSGVRQRLADAKQFAAAHVQGGGSATDNMRQIEQKYKKVSAGDTAMTPDAGCEISVTKRESESPESRQSASDKPEDARTNERPHGAPPAGSAGAEKVRGEGNVGGDVDGLAPRNNQLLRMSVVDIRRSQTRLPVKEPRSDTTRSPNAKQADGEQYASDFEESSDDDTGNYESDFESGSNPGDDHDDDCDVDNDNDHVKGAVDLYRLQISGKEEEHES